MLRRLAGSLLPRHARKALLTSAHWIGVRAEQRVCPLCSWRGRHFAPGGGWSKRRLDCVCPRCGSLERQRLAFLVAERRLRLDFSTVLHVAPESAVETWLRRRSREYVSIDLLRSAMIRMDVTALALPNRSISLIWCSHVLEHVPEDRSAIREFFRVLKPGGRALVQVPIWRRLTYEDWTKTSPDQRRRAFYQADHVRLYGLDIVDRFAEPGFAGEIHRAQDFGPSDLTTYGLSFASTDEVFVFQKPEESPPRPPVDPEPEGGAALMETIDD